MCNPAQSYINTKIKDLTGSDPFTLMFNRTCNLFINTDHPEHIHSESPILKNIANLSLDEWVKHQAKLESIVFPALRQRTLTKQEDYASKYAESHTKAPLNLPVGTMVSIVDVHRTSKNQPPMLAPYTIHSRTVTGDYIVRDQAGGILSRAVPIEQIRPLIQAKPQGTKDIFYMDFIHDHRLINGKDEYLVKWSGFPLEESTWTPVISRITKRSGNSKHPVASLSKRNALNVPGCFRHRYSRQVPQT